MAVVLDTFLNQDSGGTPTATRTFSYTCTGANLVMIVTVHTDKTVDTAGVSSVQYREQYLTKLADITTDIERVEVWWLASPAIGAHNVEVFFEAACGHTVTVATYTGSDGTYGLPVVNSGSDNAPTVTSVSAAGDVVADVVCVDSAVTISAGAGETIHGTPGTMTSPVTAQSVSGEQAGAASVTSLYSLSAPAHWLIIAVPIVAGTQTPTVYPSVVAVGGLLQTEQASDVSLTATTEATAQQIVALTYQADGLSRLRFTAYVPGFDFSGGATWVRIIFYWGGASHGFMSEKIGPTVGGTKDGARYFTRILTPTTTSFTYSIRGFVDAGTVKAEGGAGGAGNMQPAHCLMEKLNTT